MGRRAQRTPAEPRGTLKRSDGDRKSALLRGPRFFASRLIPPDPSPDAYPPGCCETPPIFQKGGIWGSNGKDNARSGATDNRGIQRGTECAKCALKSAFYAIPDYLFLHPPLTLSRNLAFRRFRNSFHLPEGRHVGGRWGWIMGGVARRAIAEPLGAPGILVKSRPLPHLYFGRKRNRSPSPKRRRSDRRKPNRRRRR